MGIRATMTIYRDFLSNIRVAVAFNYHHPREDPPVESVDDAGQVTQAAKAICPPVGRWPQVVRRQLER